MHCGNFYHDENKVMLSKINIYSYKATPAFGDMILASNSALHKTSYILDSLANRVTAMSHKPMIRSSCACNEALA